MSVCGWYPGKEGCNISKSLLHLHLFKNACMQALLLLFLFWPYVVWNLMDRIYSFNKIAFYLNKSKSTIKKSSMIDKKGFCIIYISFKIISTFVRDFWPRWSTSVIRRWYTLLFLLSFLPISNDMLFQPCRCIHLPCHRIHNVVLSHTKHESKVIFILKDTHFWFAVHAVTTRIFTIVKRIRINILQI